MPARNFIRRSVIVVGLLFAAVGVVFFARFQRQQLAPVATERILRSGGSAEKVVPSAVTSAGVETPAFVEPEGNPVARTATPKTAITDFDEWLGSWRRDESHSINLGVALARERRAELKELIARDPRAALARAVPRARRHGLPDAVLAELETPVDTFGEFEVVVGCFGPAAGVARFANLAGRRFSAHVFGRRLATLSKNHVPIHGIAVDDRLAIDERPYRRLEPAEYGDTEPAAEAALVAVGDSVRAFASSAALDEWAAKVVETETSPGPTIHPTAPPVAAAPANWTLGEKSVLWIRADFSDEPGEPASTAEINAAMSKVSDFFLDVSNGRSSFRTVILPGVLRLSKPMAVFQTDPVADLEIRTEAVALARAYDAEHGNAGTYNPDRFDRWIVVTKRLAALRVSGRGSVGAAGLFMNGTTSAYIVAHELGHNHGLQHADGWKPTGTAPAGTGEHSSYGDVFDNMGSAVLLPGGHFSSKAKEILGYLEPAHTPTINTGGTYRVFRHDDRNASGVRALRVPAGSYEYWIEHRQLIPAANFPFGDRLRDGVLILWSKYPTSLPGRGTYLLDATPNSPPVGSFSPGSAAGFDDAPFVIGQTFVDSDRGVSITPTAKGGTAPAEWIDVRIDFGATGANRNPTLTASVPATIVPARTDLAFTASASDPDGDPVSIRWNFGENQPELTGSTVTGRFIKGGTRTVRCSASDGRSGYATKSFSVTVDDPLISWTRRGVGLTSNPLTSVMHDGRQFVATGYGVVLTSPDGSAWTRRRDIDTETYAGVASNSVRLVLVGAYRASLAATPNAALIATSTDGSSWQPASFTTAALEFKDVVHGAGRFVAVGARGAILHSPDGMTWTAATSGTTQDLHDVHYAAGKFVAVGPGNAVVTSTDGITWQSRSLPVSAARVTYHRGKWIATVGVVAATSDDGLTWTEQPTNARASFQSLVSLGTSEVLLAGALNDVIYLSEDGATWDSHPMVSPPTFGWVAGACASGNTVVAVSSGGRIFQTAPRSLAAITPAITEPPQAQTFQVGQSVTLRVTATNSGLSYQWRKNGVPLPGATDAILVLRSARAEDVGTYDVTVSNFGGTVTSAGAILTLDPNTVRIVAAPTSRTVVAGSAVTLTVGATGEGPLRYQWRKDGAEIGGATDSSLALGLVSTEMAGSYTVVVADVNGSAGSAPAVLTITGATPFLFSTLAGAQRATGTVDGAGADARFNVPTGVAVDAAGYVYVADASAHTIRKISPKGVVTTIAGLPGSNGSTDGVGAAARFTGPRDVAVDSAGNIFVTDTGNSIIRKITPRGDVSAFAGQVRSPANTDGVGLAARFIAPSGLAIDAFDNLYVTDSAGHTIRKITPDGTVTTLAGEARAAGSSDGPREEARFNTPRGIAVDRAGVLYVADFGNHTIRRIAPSGAVTTVAGQAGRSGATDGVGANARFTLPAGVAIGLAGNVFVTSSATIRMVAPDGRVTTIGGAFGPSDYRDGLGTEARFGSGAGITSDSQGGLYLSDTLNAVVRRGMLVGRRDSRLTNLSVRSAAGNGADTLIVGFSLVGGAKPLLIRAIGPTLATLGVDGALNDPTLRLEDGKAVVAENDDWSSGGGEGVVGAATNVGAFALPAQSKDAALLRSLPAGAYTAQVGGGSGVALVEVYDAATAASSARLGNVSARTRAGSGADTLIMGFVVAGDTAKSVLIRGIGPSLGAFGVDGALANPRLELFRDRMPVAHNGGWGGDVELAASFRQVGAFALPVDSVDAVLLVTLLPGAYTVQVAGTAEASGVALVEIYEVP